MRLNQLDWMYFLQTENYINTTSLIAKLFLRLKAEFFDDAEKKKILKFKKSFLINFLKRCWTKKNLVYLFRNFHFAGTLLYFAQYFFTSKETLFLFAADLYKDFFKILHFQISILFTKHPEVDEKTRWNAEL